MKITKLILTLVLLCAPVFAQRYINTQQNIAGTLPGPAQLVDVPNSFAIEAFNPEHTVGAIVMSSNEKFDPPRTGQETQYWNGFLQASTPTAVENLRCQYPYWHGLSTVLCEYTATNSSGVHITGRIWATNKNGYVYDVTAFASVGTGYDDVPQKIVDSFSFPSEGNQ